eukprot:3967006-Amphidinium_carterae.1
MSASGKYADWSWIRKFGAARKRDHTYICPANPPLPLPCPQEPKLKPASSSVLYASVSNVKPIWLKAKLPSRTHTHTC